MTTREAYEKLESVSFLKDHDLVFPGTAEDIEARRRIADFAREVKIAEFMLAMSYKKPYLDLFEEKDFNNDFKHKFYSQHYLYSSLIWYINSYDMLGQCLWFFHRLYEIDGKYLTAGDFDKIIMSYRRDKITIRLYKEDPKSAQNPFASFYNNHTSVFDYGNKLKHRLFLENDAYFQYMDFGNHVFGKYESCKTKSNVKLSELQGLLMAFHNDLVKLAKEILIPIHTELNNRLLSREDD